MQEWIENVQKQNGVSQAVLDSLLSVEFEGVEQEMYQSIE